MKGRDLRQVSDDGLEVLLMNLAIVLQVDHIKSQPNPLVLFQSPSQRDAKLFKGCKVGLVWVQRYLYTVVEG